MARLAVLDDVLFPVVERPVFTVLAVDKEERRVPVPGKKAIVNVSSGVVLGVVSRTYRLVSNREALDWAFQCCRTVFPETQPCEWMVDATDAPSTGSYCAIDLSHNSAALDFSFVPAHQRPEAFGPYIRVTNSYNGLRALRFDIGYHRKVCKNGLILPQSIVRFQFAHVRREIQETIKFEVARERLTQAREAFQSSLGTLRDFPMDCEESIPLLKAVLGIHAPNPIIPKSPAEADWNALNLHIGQVATRYFDELGGNAYSAFNAITDFASHPPDNRLVRRDRHGFQTRVGRWVAEFSQAAPRAGFNLKKYIQNLDLSPPVYHSRS